MFQSYITTPTFNLFFTSNFMAIKSLENNFNKINLQNICNKSYLVLRLRITSRVEHSDVASTRMLLRATCLQIYRVLPQSSLECCQETTHEMSGPRWWYLENQLILPEKLEQIWAVARADSQIQTVLQLIRDMLPRYISSVPGSA